MPRKKAVYGVGPGQVRLHALCPPIMCKIKLPQDSPVKEHKDLQNSDIVEFQVRLHSHWPLSSAERISASYTAKLGDLHKTWQGALGLKDVERPDPYKSSSVEHGDFLPVEDAKAYAATLADPSQLSTEALYAATANSAHALKVYQDEHTAINNIIQRTAGDETLHDIYHDKKPNPRTKNSYWRKINPQHPEDSERHESIKESVLYNYKYKEGPEEEFQEPFTQAGFVPTEDQVSAIRTTRGLDTGNVDGFPTIRDRRGVETAPRRTVYAPEPKKDKKKLYDEVSLAIGPRTTRGKKRTYDFEDTEETQTPIETDTDALPTPEGTPGKMMTRFRGLKNPLMRSESVTPLPQSMTVSPAPKRSRFQKATLPRTSLITSLDPFGQALPAEAKGKKLAEKVEKNPNRSRGMRELWKRRKESGWVRKPKGSAKVDTKALAAAEKKAEEVRRNSQVTITEGLVIKDDGEVLVNVDDPQKYYEQPQPE